MALRCTALHCTALHCTALHCTALRCMPTVCCVLWEQISAEDLVKLAPAENRNRLLEAINMQNDRNTALPASKKRKSTEPIVCRCAPLRCTLL